MRHCRFGKLLAAYIASELSETERARVEAHLSVCRSCAEEAEGLARVQRLLAELAPQTPPADLVPVTLQRLEARLLRQRRWAFATSRLAMATALAACFALVIWLSAPPETNPETDGAITAYLPVKPPELVSPPALSLGVASRALTAAQPNPSPPPAKSIRRISGRALRPSRLLPLLMARQPGAGGGRPRTPKLAAKTRLPGGQRRLEDAEARAQAVLKALQRPELKRDPDLLATAYENVALAYSGTALAAQALLQAGHLQRERGDIAAADATYRRLLAMRNAPAVPQALAHQALAELRVQSVGSDPVAQFHYQQAARLLHTAPRSQNLLLARAEHRPEASALEDSVPDAANAKTLESAEGPAQNPQLPEIL